MNTDTIPSLYTWTPCSHNMGDENDQEAELGDDGWHAIVGQGFDAAPGDIWTWELWSTFLHDDPADIMASGFTHFEGCAKAEAITAYEALR